MRHIKQMEDFFASLKDVVVEDYNFEILHVYKCPVGTKGKIWVTNGTDNKMVESDDIPDGWYKGRTKVHDEEGLKKIKDQLKTRNPNAKTYRVVYRDGTEEIVTQLSTWARSKGHTYQQIKSVVYRTRHNKNIQFSCKTSPTYYIKEIMPV